MLFGYLHFGLYSLHYRSVSSVKFPYSIYFRLDILIDQLYYHKPMSAGLTV